MTAERKLKQAELFACAFTNFVTKQSEMPYEGLKKSIPDEVATEIQVRTVYMNHARGNLPYYRYLCTKNNVPNHNPIARK